MQSKMERLLDFHDEEIVDNAKKDENKRKRVAKTITCSERRKSNFRCITNNTGKGGKKLL